MTVRRYRLDGEWCDATERPCRTVACRMHLGELVRGGRQATRLHMRTYSCALDFTADNPDGCTLEEVGDQLGVTRERIRQIEEGLKARWGKHLPWPLGG